MRACANKAVPTCLHTRSDVYHCLAGSAAQPVSHNVKTPVLPTPCELAVQAAWVKGASHAFVDGLAASAASLAQVCSQDEGNAPVDEYQLRKLPSASLAPSQVA